MKHLLYAVLASLFCASLLTAQTPPAADEDTQQTPEVKLDCPVCSHDLENKKEDSALMAYARFLSAIAYGEDRALRAASIAGEDNKWIAENRYGALAEMLTWKVKIAETQPEASTDEEVKDAAKEMRLHVSTKDGETFYFDARNPGDGWFLSQGSIFTILRERVLPPPAQTVDLGAVEPEIISVLRSLTAIQETWREQDPDNNGVTDYWTADISGLYRIVRPNGRPALAIPAELAQADANALAGPTEQPMPYLAGDLRDMGQPAPLHGYLFSAVTTGPDGKPYCDPTIKDTRGASYTNREHYAFAAWPAEHGTTGLRTFVLTEEGKVYARDRGAEAEPFNTWPGEMTAFTEGWQFIPADQQ